MTPLTEWESDGIHNDWIMPAGPKWKRLPIIRHVRAIHHAINVRSHNAVYRAMGMIPTGYDEWIVHGIWLGKERDQ